MSRRIEHALALLISLVGVIASYLVADRVYDRMPHIEDEQAYVWQARVIAHGGLTIPSPPHEHSFVVPFVVDYRGQRFGKYPLGWPVVLAIGVRLGIRAWINPLLAGLGVWLTYLLGKRFFSAAVGLLAAGLTVTSPFFLMNSGSLLSHPFGLVLSAAFVLAWLNLFDPTRYSAINNPQSTIDNPQSPILNPQSPIRNPQSSIPILACGLSLGGLVLTRPFTAAAIAIPFGLHGLYLLIRGGWAARRRVLAVGLIALALSGLYFAWQKAVTGDALKNPYVLWWPYDQIGFGKGHGTLPEGHNLSQALYNTRESLKTGFRDLFGWGVKNSLASAANSLTSGFSWIFLPFGLWVVTFGRKDTGRIGWTINRQAWMLALAMASLVILYMAYWIGSDLYGPRYYYEGLYSVTLISAAGIAFLAGWPVNSGARWLSRPSDLLGRSRNQEQGAWDQASRWLSRSSPVLFWAVGLLDRNRNQGARIRSWIIALVVSGLVAYNLAVYLPDRLQEMHALYGISRNNIRQFQALLPAGSSQKKMLVIVHSDQWHFYGALLELEDPYLTTPVIFAWRQQPSVDSVSQVDFPGRAVYYYYEDQPRVLYQQPRGVK